MCTSTHNVKIINLDEPQYDLDTYWGRARHYFQKSNPLNMFIGAASLEEARCLYLKYRCNEPLPEDLDEEELWKAKALYESAYHPVSGEKINCLARPAAQVPLNAILAGGMMAFYKSIPGAILWQWLNQTYNAFVTYAHRGEASFTDKQLMTAYGASTGTAIATALGLNRLLMNAPPLIGRFAPLAAVAAAHCVNTPLMKAQVLKNGAPVFDEGNSRLGYSKKAAQAGIGEDVLTKVWMAVPPMVITPLIMNSLERRGTLCRYPWLNFPAHVGVAFLCLTLLTPLTSALLSQKAHMPFKHLEPELRDALCKKFHEHPPKYVYYEKGF